MRHFITTISTQIGRQPYLIFIMACFVLEIALVVFFSNGAGADDAEQLANSSFLAWGYGGSQPPLYTWLTILVTKIFGTHLLSLQLLKFSLLASLFLSVYTAMRKLGASIPVASAAMMGLFLLPQIGWESQRALTHSVLGTAGCGWTFLALIHYVQKTSFTRALLLGLAMAVALLGKFNTVFFIVALLAACFSLTDFRRILWQPRFIIVPLVTCVCMSPIIFWLFTHGDALTIRAGKLAIGAGDTPVFDRISGLWHLTIKTVSFTVLVTVATFICVFLVKKRKKREEQSHPNNIGEALLRRLIFFGLLAVAVFIVASGATQIKDRWLQPILFLVPAFLSLILARYGRFALVAFSRLGLVVACLAPVALALYTSGIFSRHDVPANQLDYAHIYAHVIANQPIKQVLGTDAQIGGNMRLFQPNLTILHDEIPDVSKKLAIPFVMLWTGTAETPEHLGNIVTQAGISLTPHIHHVQVDFVNAKTAKVDIYYAYYHALY